MNAKARGAVVALATVVAVLLVAVFPRVTAAEPSELAEEEALNEFVTLGDVFEMMAPELDRAAQTAFLGRVFDLPEDEAVLDEPAIVGGAVAVLLTEYGLELVEDNDGLPSAATTLFEAGFPVILDDAAEMTGEELAEVYDFLCQNFG